MLNGVPMSGFLSLTIPHDKKISTLEPCEAVTCSSAYEETVSVNVTGVVLPPAVYTRTVNCPEL